MRTREHHHPNSEVTSPLNVSKKSYLVGMHQQRILRRERQNRKTYTRTSRDR